MKIRYLLIILMFTFLPLIAHAQRNQVCNPGQYADTGGDQVVCRQCKGNTVADGTTRSCTTCPEGTAPNAKHSKCEARAGRVPVKEPVLPVEAPKGGLTGHSNYFIHSNCKPITGLSVTIDVTEDMIYESSNKGSAKGFAFQLNAYSQEGLRTSAPLKGETITTGWQQYILHVNTDDSRKTKFDAAVNNWPYPKIPHSDLINLVVPDRDSTPPYVALLPISGLPAHYKITISLATDGGSNVSGATFTVIDPHGKQYSGTITLVKKDHPYPLDKTLPAAKQGPITEANLAPILGFQLNITGDKYHVLLSRGAGTITYTASASSPLTAASSALPCFRFEGTGEDSNTNYGTLYGGSAAKITQTFSVPK
jgi:hypothetical protein